MLVIISVVLPLAALVSVIFFNLCHTGIFTDHGQRYEGFKPHFDRTFHA